MKEVVQKKSGRAGRRMFRGAWLLAGALCLSLAAEASAEDITWNGPSDPGTTPGVVLGTDPMDGSYLQSLFPSLSSVTDNRVAINANVTSRAFGGVSTALDVTGNKLTIYSGTVHEVFGGYSKNGMASDNLVTVEGGTITAITYGGYSESGLVTRNEVYFQDGSTGNNLIGGYSDTGTAHDNLLTISGGTLTQASGGQSRSGDVTGNRIFISSTATITAGVAGGSTVSGNARGNSIGFGGSAKALALQGGFSNTGNAEGNSVRVIGDAEVTQFIAGGRSYAGSATSNRVIISNNATIGSHIYGGMSHLSATDNHVEISGGTVGGDIYGAISTHSNASDNIVTITGSPDLTRAGLYGGKGNVSTGNILNVHTTITVSHLAAFQEYRFYLPDTLAPGDAVITVTDGGEGGGVPIDLDSVSAQVGINSSLSPLKGGDTIVLITETGGNGITGSLLNTTSTGEGMAGISTEFSFELTLTPDSLIATVISSESNEQLKSLSESRIAGLGMLTQGVDMLAMQGISQLRLNAAAASGPAMFGVMGGQSLRYNSGSHVDVDGFNLVTGLGWNAALADGENGNLLLGAFFEAGWGSYDSHNSFGNAASVTGDGDSNYYGAGILARYDSMPVGPGNIYLETSLRAGKVETDYESEGFKTSSGNEVSFDSSAAYYGAHAGLGYIWNISEASSLDMYTKYLWTRQDSDSVTIEGDSIRFKTMDSHRWRTGARFAHIVNTESGLRFTPYIGAAYEHEFDSKARGTSNGDSIDAPDVEGGTGIGELGFSFQPSADSGLSLDLGVQGYTGQREGIGGSFQIKWEF